VNEAIPEALLAGLIGAGISGSLAPALHEAEAAAQGLRLVYRRLDLSVLGLGLDALDELLVAAGRFGFTGLNVTFPAKQAVIPLLDELSPDAAAIGAVNTVLLRDGRRVGHNTDASGFAEGFRRGLPGAAPGRVALLGAGGAGAAVGRALLGLGAERIAVCDTDPARAAALAARLGPRAMVAAGPADALAGADGLVNCTPIGMLAHPGLPLPATLLHPGLWVADVVYVPLDTALLRAARTAGCRTLDGGGMAVFQAVGALRLFAAIEPDAPRMRRHFEAMTR
jgi:shikimate dehydrogenase